LFSSVFITQHSKEVCYNSGTQVSELLRMIGIDPVRIVTGITRAKLVYLPQVILTFDSDL